MADPQNPLLDLLRALGAINQQTVASTPEAIREQGVQRRASNREGLFGRQLGRYGTPIDQVTGKEQGNPFDNGFFKSNAERQAIIADRQVGMPTAADLPNNPYYQDWAAAFMTPNTSVDAPLPFTQILNEPITNPALDGGASAQDRTARALRSRRPQFSIF